MNDRNSAGQTPGDLGNAAADKAKSGLALLRDNPLGLLFVGFAVGTIVGVLAPVSRLESDKMAPLRDEVVDLAKRAADDVVEHGRGVVEETFSAASDAAARHGQALAEDLEQEFRSIAPTQAN